MRFRSAAAKAFSTLVQPAEGAPMFAVPAHWAPEISEVELATPAVAESERYRVSARAEPMWKVVPTSVDERAN